MALSGQILGFLRNRLVSTNFTVHTPGASDAFFVAFQIPDFFFYVIAAGALGVAFIPIISERLHLGDRKGLWELTSSLLNSLAIIMAVVSVILFIFAAPLIHLLAPDLSPAHFNDAVNIMRLISFNPLFFTLSGVVTSIQQAMGRFFFFAIAPLTYNLSIIASIYLFKDNIGIVGLGVGALIGAVLQMLVAWLGMWGLGFKWHPKILWKNQHFRSVLRALPPRSIDQGVDQLNSIVETNRAQALGIGPVSYYNYALTLQNVPIMLIGTSIATAAFPKLTERLANHRPDLFRKDFLAILRVVIWLAVPTVIAMYFCRGYLARLITGDASPKVSTILGFLTASILFRIIYTMISRWFYAQKDTKTPLYISIFAITLNIILAFSLATKDGYNIAGLAMAQSITAAAEVTVLTTIMFLRDRKMLDAALFGSLVKIVAVSGFSIMAAFIMSHLLPLTLADRGIITLGLKLAAIGSVTFAVHILISGFFGMDEARPIFKWLRRIVLHPIKVDY